MRSTSSGSSCPLFCGLHNKDLTIKERYRCMRNSMLIAMLAITLIPMTIISGINFVQYRQLLQNDSYTNAQWSTESARATITAYLEKMEAAITVVLDSYTYEELTDQQQLDHIFKQLKEEHIEDWLIWVSLDLTAFNEPTPAPISWPARIIMTASGFIRP
jgi:hypothetical protein